MTERPQVKATPRSDDPQDVAAARVAEAILNSPQMSEIIHAAVQRHVMGPIVRHVLNGDHLPIYLADVEQEIAEWRS